MAQKTYSLSELEPKENSIVNAVGEYLTKRNHFFFRTNNAPVAQRDKKGGFFFRKASKYAMAGVPDFILIDKIGRFIGLECKRPISGRQSPDQKKFQARCLENGAEYLIIRKLEDLKENGL